MLFYFYQVLSAAKGAIADTVMAMFEGFILPLQTLINPSILINSPPFYVYTARMRLSDLNGVTFTSDYGAIAVSSVTSTNTTLLTISDNVIAMVRVYEIYVYLLYFLLCLRVYLFKGLYAYVSSVCCCTSVPMPV